MNSKSLRTFWFLLAFSAEFGWTRVIVETVHPDSGLSRTIFEDGPFGGSGGRSWTDLDLANNGPITGMYLRTNVHIDSIRTRYGTVWSDWHGLENDNSVPESFSVDEGDSIFMVQGRHGLLIDSLEFYTTAGEIFGPFGGDGGVVFTSAHPGCELSYLSGQAGDRLDALTLYWLCP